MENIIFTDLDGPNPFKPSSHPQVRCSPHQSAKVSSMCLRAKDHLEGTKVAVFPRNCAENKVQTGSAADWRSPKSGDQEDDGRPDHLQGAGDPEVADGGIRMWRPEKRALVPVAFHDDTCRGSRARLPLAQPLRRLRTSRLALPRWFAPLKFAVSVFRLCARLRQRVPNENSAGPEGRD